MGLGIPDNINNNHFNSAVTQAVRNDQAGADFGRFIETSSDWWYQSEIEAVRWNKSYPYQFLIVEAKGGTYNSIDGFSFTLPIPPQSLSIQTPFAISTMVTLGGIVEQHNAIPIKMISLTGTTGVLPLKGTIASINFDSANATASSIFGGVISGASSVANSAVDFSRKLTGADTNLVSDTSFSSPDEIGRTSGYYQFKLLERFLENYALLKKQARGRRYRLALAMWKDQTIYLVTPQSFNVDRRSGAPLEYSFSIQLKAWRRISLNQRSKEPTAYTPIKYSKNQISQLLGGINAARQILSSVSDTLASISTDVQSSLFEPLRQTALFVKGLAGVGITAADMPWSVLNSCGGAIAEWTTIDNSFSSAGNTIADNQKSNQDNFEKIKRMVTDGSGGTTGVTTQSLSNSASPANSLWSSADSVTRNYALFNCIPVSQLNLGAAIKSALNQDRANVSNFTRDTFEAFKNSIDSVATDFANAHGLGSTAINTTYNLPTRATTAAGTYTGTPTDTDWDILFTLNQVTLELARLAASRTINNTRQLSSVEYVAGLAARSGIAFQIPRSKYAVPFPYGYTLERLSNMYLNTPNRWEEIVALNGLKSPYVDEQGFDLPLLVNGMGNVVMVSNSDNLYIGQQVWISAAGVQRTIRRITKIETTNFNYSLITLDGTNNLNIFTVANVAVLHAFLPDTVNSQMLIYIPSDADPAYVDNQLKSIPGATQYDQFLLQGGIDLLLTQDNDLAVTPDGDCGLAVGLTNITQEVRLVLSCPRGGLIDHLSYGLPIEAGTSIADVDAQSLAKTMKDLFSFDPMFTGVYGVNVIINGPVAGITLAVGVKGIPSQIPISVNILK